MLRRLVSLSALALATVALAPPADACLHAAGAAATDEPITQRGQQAIILHDGQVEDLILRVEYFDVDAPALGWVVPVPSIPTAYEAVDAKLFDEVGDWVNLRRQPVFAAAARGVDEGDAAPEPTAAVTLLPPAKVGPYDIQPMKAQGAEAAKALNEWMTGHGFAEIPTAGLQYYVDREWTFLAIKIDPEAGKTKVAADGGLPPLQVTFPTPAAVYPLKLSTHMGEFTARAYLITAAVVPTAALSGLAAKGFEVIANGHYVPAPRFATSDLVADVDGFDPATAPESLQPLLTSRFDAGARLHLTVLFSERVNADAADHFPDGNGSFRPADWDEDVAVPPLPAPPPKTPTADEPTTAGGDTKAPNVATPEPTAPPPTPEKASPPVSAPEAPKGCGCRTDAPRTPKTAWPWLLAALGLTARRRRSS